MDGLSVLSKVVEAGEASATVTLERSLARVLPNMSCQVLTPSETEVAGRIAGAEESLTGLLLGGGDGGSIIILCWVVLLVFGVGPGVHVVQVHIIDGFPYLDSFAGARGSIDGQNGLQ